MGSETADLRLLLLARNEGAGTIYKPPTGLPCIISILELVDLVYFSRCLDPICNSEALLGN